MSTLTLHDIFLIIFFILSGMLFSGFIGLVLYRTKKFGWNYKTIKDISLWRSYCESCHKQLRLIDILPVIWRSLQKWKCRHCWYEIPSKYMYQEFWGWVLGLVIWVYVSTLSHDLFTMSILTIPFWLMVLMLCLFITLEDFEYKTISDKFIVPLSVLLLSGLLYQYFSWSILVYRVLVSGVYHVDLANIISSIVFYILISIVYFIADRYDRFNTLLPLTWSIIVSSIIWYLVYIWMGGVIWSNSSLLLLILGLHTFFYLQVLIGGLWGGDLRLSVILSIFLVWVYMGVPLLYVIMLWLLIVTFIGQTIYKIINKNKYKKEQQTKWSKHIVFSPLLILASLVLLIYFTTFISFTNL